MSSKSDSKLDGDIIQGELSAKKEGWLTKLGGKGLKKNWRKRWFVLANDSGEMYYFKKNEKTELAVGMIHLADYGVVSEEPSQGKKFFFKIHNEDHAALRVFQIYADSKNEMDSWIEAINQYFDGDMQDLQAHLADFSLRPSFDAKPIIPDPKPTENEVSAKSILDQSIELKGVMEIKKTNSEKTLQIEKENYKEAQQNLIKIQNEYNLNEKKNNDDWESIINSLGGPNNTNEIEVKELISETQKGQNLMEKVQNYEQILQEKTAKAQYLIVKATELEELLQKAMS